MLWNKFCALVLSSVVSVFPFYTTPPTSIETTPTCAIKETVSQTDKNTLTMSEKKHSDKQMISHTAVIYDTNKKVKGKKEVFQPATIHSSNQRVTVLVAADEEYREEHPDWMDELTNDIVEGADEAFKRDHDLDFDVTGFAEWDSNGSDAGDMLEDLKDDWDDLGYDFVLGFTADSDFEHAGLAYVYSNPPNGSAMSILKDRNYDRAIATVRHEWSHNLGLSHHSSSSNTKCIMNTDYIDEVDYWCDRHDEEIEENKWWYNIKKIQADVETDEVEEDGDAAEAPAIWVHPTDPSLSKIIATDKKEGALIYDLDGNKLNFYDFGRLNSIDIRYNFPMGNKLIDIAAASNRSDDTIDIFEIKNNGNELEKIGEIETDLDVYGLCLYHSLRTGKFYAMLLSDDDEFEQYELYVSGSNEISGIKVRDFEVDSKSEGIVTDDEYGVMYIAEENDALWKYGAEPDAGDDRIEIDDVDDSDYIEDDLEGLTLYYGRDGTGFLIVSSQGNDQFAIYDRQTNDYIGNFTIVDGPEIDGTTETDGIDVMSFGLGPKFPYGIFVAQDDENTDEDGDEEKQNFKIVSWKKIADAFQFDLSNNQINPRALIQRNDSDF